MSTEPDLAEPHPHRTRLRAWKIAVILGALLVLGLVSANYFLARHRSLHVVNGFTQPLLLRIIGGASVRIPPLSQVPIEVREGKNNVQVSGPTNLSLSFVMPGSLRDRWLGGQQYVLNPAGAAVLITESVGPLVTTNTGSQRSRYQLHFGQTFAPLPDVDYLFRDFPPTLKNPATEKKRVDILRVGIPEFFFSLVGGGRTEEALRLAEWYLQNHPNETELLPTYVGVAMATRQAEQARTFLRAGSQRRPINIQWHRMYQEVEQTVGSTSNLTAHYDQLLRADRTNSALWYLRGRLAAHKGQAVPYYEQALAYDTNNAFAHYALGYSFAGIGDWSNARPYLARACLLHPHDLQMQELYFDSRIALGEAAVLERELIAARTQDPSQFGTTLRLAEVWIVQGRTNELENLVRNFREILAVRIPAESAQITARLRSRIAYAQGDFQALAELGRKDPTPDGQLNLFFALLNLGRFAEAATVVPPDSDLLNDPMHPLAVSLAMVQGGASKLAAPWYTQAVRLMRAGREEYRLAAAMLESSNPPAVTSVLALALPPQSKAVLFAALAQRFPAAQSEFSQRARILNVHREFPYHIVARCAGS